MSMKRSRCAYVAAVVACATPWIAVPADSARAGETITTTTTTTYPTGEMTIVSEEKRTFRVGDTEVVYTAPADVDLDALDGSQVRVEIAPTGDVTRITRTTTVRTVE